jgi:hypothetical protein
MQGRSALPFGRPYTAQAVLTHMRLASDWSWLAWPRCRVAVSLPTSESTSQARAWRAICACRTEALGGKRLACANCGRSHWCFHFCRNRRCPKRGARAARPTGRCAGRALCALVFTLPHQLTAAKHVSRAWSPTDLASSHHLPRFGRTPACAAAQPQMYKSINNSCTLIDLDITYRPVQNKGSST